MPVTKTDKAPFSNTGIGVDYVGGDQPIMQKVDDGRTMAVSTTGTASETDVFKMLIAPLPR